ncbi:virulence factor TspB C-terminal domain-related protein [Vibrio sp. EA2]|uniref:virulence factor TspB C-terminal domain-related protein n=1 Tax=Vibrio sp. EA2 TaxID=3079860 RepID=UPI00294A0060|nr:virulence factor TspB C-terminal domain-related protein [Vibrio sp. EA2]MDV6250161.1 virulence factor TspB C-terminal domain-related protein [Vibrio sp. EA2]
MKYIISLFLVLMSFQSSATVASIPSEKGRGLKVEFYCYYENPFETVTYRLDAPYKGPYPVHLCREYSGEGKPASSKWGRTKYITEYHCPNPDYPVLSEDKMTCYAAEPVKPSCDDPELQKEIQHAHHACKLSMPETEFFSNVFKWWCENGDVYTYCGLEPKNCIQGLTCSKPDFDVPVCNPAKEECELPEPDPDTPGTPETPIPDIKIEKPEEPPEDYCKQFPDMCIVPEYPNDPDLPNPDPDVPNKPDETANNLLENIHATLDSFRTNSMLDNNKDGRWQQHMLGQVRALLKALKDGVKVNGGGGGSEAGMAALGDKLGEKLDEIKCELAEDCEGEEKEKPSAKVDCEKSIFECKGDVIQCALLKVQYEDTCPVEQLAELKDKMDKLFVTDRTGELVDKDTIDFSKIDSKYLSNGVSFGNANCPSPESFTINHFAGSTSVEISYEPACHYARIAAPVHVILAWVAGLLLIGRTQGAF